MVDVNLPEHRGTATSFFSLTEQIGKSITLFIASGLILLFGYNRSLMYGTLFYIPAAFFWFLVVKNIQKDIDSKSLVLRERAQSTFIDFFFELEISIDDGVQLIQDAKNILIKDQKKSQKLIDKAIDKFKLILAKARKKDIADIELKAHDLLNKALIFKNDFLMISKNPTEIQLEELVNKIEEIWEKSDYGKIEVLYEDAYLKVCEARLLRHYNPITCIDILKIATEIYDRVSHLCEDRVVEENAKKLTEDEERFQNRVNELLILSQKSKANTNQLRNKLEEVIRRFLEKDIRKEELEDLVELTSEYGLKLQDVMADAFEGKFVKEIRHLTDETDELFKLYDEWQAEEVKDR
jgi:hypothetical protein